MTTKLVCKLCGAPAKQAEPEVYQHSAESPWDDQSGFCDKYGYPIPVVEADRPEVELDSPNFTPEELKALAARGFERRNGW